MSKFTQNRHDFHFIINKSLKRKLLALPCFQNTSSLSTIIIRILQLLYSRLEKEHFFGDTRHSQYKLVTTDSDEKRCSVHVYLPVNLYKRLKSVLTLSDIVYSCL